MQYRWFATSLCVLFFTTIAEAGKSSFEYSPRRVAIDDAGSLVAQAGPEKQVKIWNVKDGKLLANLTTLLEATAVCLTPDGKHCFATTDGDRPDATVGAQGWLVKWSIENNEWKEKWKRRISGSVTGLNISRDGGWLALTTVYAHAYILDTDDGYIRRTFVERANPMTDCALTRNANMLFSGGNSFRMWDVKAVGVSRAFIEADMLTDEMYQERDKRCLRAKMTPTAPLVALDPSEKYVAVLGAFRSRVGKPTELVTIDLATAKQRMFLHSSEESGSELDNTRCSCLTFTRSGELLAGYHDGAIAIWDVRTKPYHKVIRTGRGNLLSIVHVPGTQDAIIFCAHTGLHRISLTNGEETRHFEDKPTNSN